MWRNIIKLGFALWLGAFMACTGGQQATSLKTPGKTPPTSPTTDAATLSAPLELGAVGASRSVTLSWEASNALSVGFVVLLRTGSAVEDTLVDGTTYAIGEQISAETSVLHIGTESSLPVSGLLPLFTYHFAVFAYDDSLNYSAPTLLQTTVESDRRVTLPFATHFGATSAAALSVTASGNEGGFTHTPAVMLNSGDIVQFTQVNTDWAETGAGNFDIAHVKYNNTGAPQSVWHFGDDLEDTQAGDESAMGEESMMDAAATPDGGLIIALNSNGNFGELAINTSQDIAFVKLSATDQVEWVRHIGDVTEDTILSNGATAGKDDVNAVAVDENSNIYFCGKTVGNYADTAKGTDFIVGKLSPLGVPIWIKQFGDTTEAEISGADASGTQECTDIAVDHQGNIFITGETFGSLVEPIGGSRDIFIARLDTDGNFVWMRQLGTTTDDELGTNAIGTEYNSTIALGPDNSLYVSAETTGSAGATGANDLDVFWFKMSQDGDFIFSNQLGSALLTALGANDAFEWNQDILTDTLGNFYVLGLAEDELFENPTSENVFMMKFDSDGNLLWHRQWGQTTSPLFGLTSVGHNKAKLFKDDYNNICITGQASNDIIETSAGGEDLFIFCMTSDGNPQ